MYFAQPPIFWNIPDLKRPSEVEEYPACNAVGVSSAFTPGISGMEAQAIYQASFFDVGPDDMADTYDFLSSSVRADARRSANSPFQDTAMRGSSD